MNDYKIIFRDKSGYIACDPIYLDNTNRKKAEKVATEELEQLHKKYAPYTFTVEVIRLLTINELKQARKNLIANSNDAVEL